MESRFEIGGKQRMQEGVKVCRGKSPWEILVRLVTETKTWPQNFGSLTVDVVVVVVLVARDVPFFYFPSRK
jgi:hypothetical protein